MAPGSRDVGLGTVLAIVVAAVVTVAVGNYLIPPVHVAHMAFTKTNYREVEPVADAMHFLRDPLECDQLGVTVVECDPGWTGKEHDHADGAHEEVYLLLDGEAAVAVDGEEIELTPGDALRIEPEAQRQIRNGDTESTFVLVGAP